MRRIIKKLSITLSVIIGLLLLSVIVVLMLDQHQTKYLNIASNSSWQQQSYTITNVHIIPMSHDTVLKAKTVHIKDGYIHAITDVPSKDNSDSVIDAEGAYLSPGLIDMHVHVWDRYELGLYLANGITTVRNMWGMPLHLNIQEGIHNDELLGPQFYTASPKLTGPEDMGIDKVQIASPEAARSYIKTYKSQGYDLIKTYAGMPKDIFDAVIDQAQKEGLRIAAHPSHQVDYAYHFQPIFESVEHTEDILQTALEFDTDSTKINEVIQLYKSHHKAHTPTLSIFQNIIDIMEDPDIFNSEMSSYMNPGFVKLGSIDDYNRWTSELSYQPDLIARFKTQHQTHLNLVKQLHDAHVPIICGSDSGIMFAAPGFSTHEELAYYQDAGLSNYEALATATKNPAQISKRYTDYGTIEVGKMANLILTKGNPLEDLTHLKTPETIWMKGRMLDANTLEGFKKKAQNRSNGLATILRFLHSFL